MGSIWKENYKRAAKKNSIAALDDHDLVRVEDIAGLGGGSANGVYSVFNLTTPSPHAITSGADETFDFVVILVAGSYDVILPTDAVVGKRYEIKDGFGDGCTGGVSKRILTAGSHTIEGLFTEFALNNCYQSWSLIYAGSDIWRLV